MKFFFNGGEFHQLIDTIREFGHTIAEGEHSWINYIHNDKMWKDYNLHILRTAIEKEQPDIYFCLKGFKRNLFIYPETVKWIKKHVKLTIYWSLDDPFFIPTFMHHKMYEGYDIALSCTTASFNDYRKVGISPYLFWPAWDEKIRKIIKIPEDKKIDIIFVGTPYICTDIPRKDMLLWAIRNKLTLEIYGDKSWISNKRIGNFIQGDQRLTPYYKGKWNDWRTLHDLFCRSRINISNHVIRAPMYLNDRVSLVMGSGNCLMMDRNPGIENIFKHNKEVIFYENFPTFENRIKYYLNHPQGRKEMGEKAREKILNEHTYKHRAIQLLDIIYKNGIK